VAHAYGCHIGAPHLGGSLAGVLLTALFGPVCLQLGYMALACHVIYCKYAVLRGKPGKLASTFTPNAFSFLFLLHIIYSIRNGAIYKTLINFWRWVRQL
jgi:hypothetical protein